MRTLITMFAVLALATAGCGRKSSDGDGTDGDGASSVAPPSSGGVGPGGLPGSASKADAMAYPAKSIAKLKDSFAPGGPTITEETANRAIKTQTDIAAFAKRGGRPMESMAKMQTVFTGNGWKGQQEFSAANARVFGAMGVLGQLQAVEMGMDPSGKLLEAAAGLIQEARLTEADLKLVHKLQPKFQKMSLGH